MAGGHKKEDRYYDFFGNGGEPDAEHPPEEAPNLNPVGPDSQRLPGRGMLPQGTAPGPYVPVD